MTPEEQASKIVETVIDRYQITRHPWSEGLIGIIERAIIAAEEEATKKERDRSIELVRRCHKVYECEANRERNTARAKGLQPSKIDDYEEIFVYCSDLEKRLCEKATACEYVEMVIREWSLDSSLMLLPF